MAEEPKKTVEVEEKDPWDFDDPEIEAVVVVEEDMPAETEEVTEDTSEDLPDEIVDRAREAGLTKDELENMGSPDTAQFVLDLLQQKTQQLEEEARNTTSKDGDAVQEEPSSEPGGDEFDWIDKLDPDDSVDSDAIKALKVMKAKLDERCQAR